MDTNWVPGAAIGFLGSIVAWVLAGARFEVQTKADIKRATEIRDADLKRAEELRAADVRRFEELRAADARRAEELRADLRDMKSAWDAGIDRVGGLAANMASLQASQNQVNIFNAKTMESTIDKMERHEAILADHTSAIRLLVDKVMAK